MRIGYARVSTRDQNHQAQHDALQAASCDEIYTDVASGKLASRPELDKVLLRARTGDTVVITKLDRLGRSMAHLIELSAHFQTQGIDLVVLAQGVDTSTPVGRLFFHILGAIAEFERELIVERTRDGLAVARARGRVPGSRPKLTPRQARIARDMYDTRQYTVQQIADEFAVTRATIYRHINKLDKPEMVSS